MNIDVPEYGHTFKFDWEYGFMIKCTIKDACAIIEANREGLISLARHLLELAGENVPDYTHFHLDELNSLEENSSELIIVRKNTFES